MSVTDCTYGQIITRSLNLKIVVFDYLWDASLAWNIDKPLSKNDPLIPAIFFICRNFLSQVESSSVPGAVDSFFPL